MSPFQHVHGDALNAYPAWPGPDIIMSDGAYGVRGFHGDTVGPQGLVDWYRLHIEAWSTAAKPSTTLWFWNTEVGWATVHPVLEANGWRYVQTVTWDKGISHVAGNVNSRTIRRLPVVSEIVALYERDLVLESDTGPMGVQEWLRHEWQRSGLPLYKSNEACGVKNAATRKYLTKDWLFYFPPGEMVERMSAYCTKHGREADRPYFSINGLTAPIAKEWEGLRRVWNHQHALTNVWQRPPLHDSERLKGSMRRAAPRVYKPTGTSAAHLNQKPLDLMERLIAASSQPGDVVWEPFGGLASGSVAAVALGRRAYVSEMDAEFARVGRERLEIAAAEADASAEQASLVGDPKPQNDTEQWAGRRAGTL